MAGATVAARDRRWRLGACAAVLFGFLLRNLPVGGASMAQAGAACPDADNDSYADCSVPGCDSNGLVCGDCDDEDLDIHPGATEVCNHRDDSCDGRVDETFAQPLQQRPLFNPQTSTDQHFGAGVVPLGDVDGDLLGDFAVGIEGQFNPWSVQVFSGANERPLCRAAMPAGEAGNFSPISLAAIDDLSGDGVRDFLVGMPWAKVGLVQGAGKVFIYSGADCSLIRALAPPTPVLYATFGEAVADAGDVNGDGVPDVAVSEPEVTLGSGIYGRVHVFSGRDGTRLWTLDNPPYTNGYAGHLGTCLAGGVDLDQDGRPDIVACDPERFRPITPQSPASGMVLAISGRTGQLLPFAFGPVPVIGSTNGALGVALAFVPDLDFDQVEDLAVTFGNASTYSGTPSQQIMIFSGAGGALLRSMGDPDGIWNEHMGFSLAFAGDWNQDGVPDLVAGTPGHDGPGGTDSGALTLFSLADGSVIDRVDPAAAVAGLQFGRFAALLDDLDGDGRREIAGAAEGTTLPGAPSPGVVVHAAPEADCDGDGVGPLSGDCDDQDPLVRPGVYDLCDGRDTDCNGTVDDGDADGDGFTACVDCNDGDPTVHPGVLDLCNGRDDDCNGVADDADPDGDGYTACIDCGNFDASIHPGAHEVCDGVDQDCNGRIDEAQGEPDLDNDGYGACDCDDSNPLRHPGRTETCNHMDDNCSGEADEGFARIPGFRIVESRLTPFNFRWDNFGTALASVGDLNGDGVPDYAVGAPEYEGGRVFLHSGADDARLATRADPGTSYPSSYNHVGFSLQGIGDVDGDGVPDVAAGDPTANSALGVSTGRVVLFSGAKSAPIGVLTDPQTGTYAYFGWSLGRLPAPALGQSPVLVVGEPGLAGGCLIALPARPGATPLWRFCHPDNGSQYARLGNSLAIVGDRDGDGYPDLAIGAPLEDAPKADQGAIYVLSGATGTLIHKMDTTGLPIYSQLGMVVVALGDIDGDGVDDIAARGYSKWYKGQVRVFSGASDSLLYSVDSPDQAQAQTFALAILGLPDLSGDGVPDLLASNPRSDARVVDGGRVYLLSGADGTLLSTFAPPAPRRAEYFGRALANAGDLDGDGASEYLIGAPGYYNNVYVQPPARVYVLANEADCDGDGLTVFAKDCDDMSAACYPGHPEVCDGLDNDCDGMVDADQDGDGVGLCQDCDDHDPRRFPGHTEVCDGLDNDCNGLVDDGADADGDTFTTVCDCDDGNAAVFPGHAEICDHVDNNCDGLQDETSTALTITGRIDDPGAVPNGTFGAVVAVVPDLNGDGKPDVVVGSPGTGRTDAFSSATFQKLWSAGTPQTYSGGAFASIPDQNGDGVADVLIGQPTADLGGATDAGGVLLVSGATGAIIRQFSPPTPTAYGHFGLAVAVTRDLDGDARPDLVVGSPGRNTSGLHVAGAVQIVSSLNGALLRTLVDPDPSAEDLFGRWLETGADLNRDGTRDILVGAPGNHSAGGVIAYAGSDGAILYSLSDLGAPVNGAPFDSFGITGAILGDLDGDQVPDFAVGAPGWDHPCVTNAGRVLVFSGASGTLLYAANGPLPAYTGTCGSAPSPTALGTGVSITALPDLSGDGVPDFAAGASATNYTGTNQGAALLFSGADGGLARVVDPGTPVAGERFAAALASLGPLDATGFPTLLIGRPFDGSLSRAGSVSILTAPRVDCDGDGWLDIDGDCDDRDPTRAPGTLERCNGIDDDCNGQVDDGIPRPVEKREIFPDTTLSGLHFGDSIGILPDLNGDGWPEAVVGAPYDDEGPPGTVNERGRIRVISTYDSTTLCGFSPPTTELHQYLGAAIAIIPDQDGDGAPEVAAGAPGGVGSVVGRVWVVSSRTCQGLFSIQNPPGARPADLFGAALLASSDLNGDGQPDLIVGAPGQGALAHAVLLSGMGLGVVRTFDDPLAQSGDALGTSLAVLANVNDGGNPQLAVGAPMTNYGSGAQAGRVTVFSIATGAVVKYLVSPTGGTNHQWGSTLLTLPELNGDDRPELAVGAEWDDTAGADSGSVTIFDVAAEAVIRPPQSGGPGSHYGHALALLGDFDGDGRADYAVGAPDPSSSGGPGSIDVRSSATGSALVGYTNPTVAHGHLGSALASAGDLDGDGLPELIAGAGNAYNQGRAYLFSDSPDCDRDGHTRLGGDCDDSNPLVGPGRPDVCNGADDDCDGAIDETDADGDGYAVCDDCDDSNPARHPGAAEICNGLDENCNGVVDDGPDLDLDGYGACDCDDTRSSVHPGAPEQCNGMDDDCDGAVDEGDADGDGYGFCVDCNDHAATVHPGAVEVCDGIDNDCDGLIDENLREPETCNGVDDNCNGLIDEGDPGGGKPCSTGAPGVCDAGVTVCAEGTIRCRPVTGAGTEICNGQDDDCDGVVDDVGDTDHDGINDCIDNCVGVYNPGQEDYDHDLVGDACDCDPNSDWNPAPEPIGSVLKMHAPPSPGGGVFFIDLSGMDPPGEVQVYRGWIDRSGTRGYNHSCLGSTTTSSTVDSRENPRPGTAFYYVVGRVGGFGPGSPGCGLSSLGTGSNGVERPAPPACFSTGYDTDGDGWADHGDDCPGLFNPTQADVDNDGWGDACDNCVDLANRDQIDLDGNGVGDACEPLLLDLP